MSNIFFVLLNGRELQNSKKSRSGRNYQGVIFYVQITISTTEVQYQLMHCQFLWSTSFFSLQHHRTSLSHNQKILERILYRIKINNDEKIHALQQEHSEHFNFAITKIIKFSKTIRR